MFCNSNAAKKPCQIQNHYNQKIQYWYFVLYETILHAVYQQVVYLSVLTVSKKKWLMCPTMTSVTLQAQQQNGIMESSTWRGASWGDCRRQPEMVPMWRGAANHSKHRQRRPGKLDRRWLTAAYGGWVTVTASGV